MNRLQLPTVSLLGCTTRDHKETLLAIKHGQNLIEFGNTVYFSNINPYEQFPEITNTLENFEYIVCPKFNEYHDICIWFLTSIFKYKKHFKNHTMSIHHDGYPIRCNAWLNEFLDYSFIGPPWLWGGVGNNAICIYDQKYIAAIESLNLPPIKEACHPSDMVLFNNYEKFRNELGIKIAPIELALKFAVEGHRYDQYHSFGFHGLYNLVGTNKIEGVIVPEHHHHIQFMEDFHRYSPLPKVI